MKLLFSSLYFFFFYPTISNGAKPIVRNITVDQRGHADFTRIQAAINSVPDGNKEWIRIHIKPGFYSEQVSIPAAKGFVILEGNNPRVTTIEFESFIPNGLAGNLMESSTFVSEADNVVLKGIRFQNLYKGPNLKRAIAAQILGDKTSIYNCEFIGLQDTLCDQYGRHYYKDCYIEGVVDFIFGFGQSIFEGCTIHMVATNGGWMTAHGRWQKTDPTGFVFKSCNVTGWGKNFLGRAWGEYARVIFYKTAMSNVVLSQGWDAWNTKQKGALTTFAESGCTGPGSNTAGRVKWAKKLRDSELDRLTSMSFIDTEGWIGQQPAEWHH